MRKKTSRIVIFVVLATFSISILYHYRKVPASLYEFYSNSPSLPWVSQQEWHMYGYEAAGTHASLNTGPHNIDKKAWQFVPDAELEGLPLVHGNIVVVASSDRGLYSLNRWNGNRQWTLKTKEQQGFSSTPVISKDGFVYIGADTKLLAVDANSGNVKWSTNVDGSIIGRPIVRESTVFATTRANQLIAFNTDSGDTRWTAGINSTFRKLVTSPAVEGDTVVYGSTNRGGKENIGFIHAVDADSGDTRWTYQIDVGIYRSSPAIKNNMVFIGGLDNDLHAVNLANGKRVWEYQTDGNIHSSPTVVGGSVFIGTQNQHLIGLTRKTGEQKWRRDLGEPIEYTTVFAENLYAVTSNTVHILSPDSGKVLDRYELTASITSPPVVANGYVYVNTDEGLFALR